MEWGRPRTVRPPHYAVLEKFVKCLTRASKYLWTETSSFGKNRRSSGGYHVSYPGGVAVGPETRMLYLREFFQDVSVFSGDLDDLVVERGGIRVRQGGWNSENHPTVDEAEDSSFFKVNAKAGRVR